MSRLPSRPATGDSRRTVVVMLSGDATPVGTAIHAAEGAPVGLLVTVAGPLRFVDDRAQLRHLALQRPKLPVLIPRHRPRPGLADGQLAGRRVEQDDMQGDG